MFEAVVLACMLPYMAPCAVVEDVHGPYITEERCEARIEEMARDIPQIYPGYIKFDSMCYVDKNKPQV